MVSLKTFSLLIIFISSYFTVHSQTPFSSVDLNDPNMYYGNWKGIFHFKTTASNQLIELFIERDSISREIIVSIRSSQTNKIERIVSTFNNSDLSIPYSVTSVNAANLCKGSILVSLLDENHLTGTFNSRAINCSVLEINAERVVAKKQSVIKENKGDIDDNKRLRPIPAQKNKTSSKQTSFVDTKVSDGARLLFNNSKTSLTITDKNQIFQKLGFLVSSDRKTFINDKEDEVEESAHFGSAIVNVVDLNKDGVSEVFVQWGNTYTSGNAGTSITLFIKKGDVWESNLGFPGIGMLTSNYTLGYRDVLIGGPGLRAPLWKWNGNKYVLYKSLSTSSDEYKKVKITKLPGTESK